jgi:hypothetical protein
MNSIKTAAEDLAIAVITNIRDILTPIINKYAAYYKYIQFFLYGTYALLLLGIYNTVPQYIPTLRSTILYVAVFILLLRFNSISWTNPKFAIIGGGSTFSEFDRRLIISTCIFILITHVVSEAAVEYAKRQLQKQILVPFGIVGEKVFQ